MKLHELQPAPGSRKKLFVSAAESVRATAKRLAVVTKVKKLAPAEGFALDLKEAKRLCSAACRNAGSRTSTAKNMR